MSQISTKELLRLRSEVGLLRRKLEAGKQTAAQRMSTGERRTPAAPHAPGTHIAKDELAFAGYATPPATLESSIWAMNAGDYEETIAAHGGSEEAVRTIGDKTKFAKDLQELGPLFRGLQIVASKTLSDGRVELLARMEMDRQPNETPGPARLIPFLQKMVKTGNEWKTEGGSNGVPDNWDQDGQIQTYAP